MKIKKFDRKSARELRDLLNEDLKKLSSKYGVSMEAHSMTFSDYSATIKLETKILSPESEKVNDVEMKKEATLFGNLSKNQSDKLMGFSFSSGRFTFTVVGHNPSKPKYAVKLKRNDGKQFSTPWSDIKRHMTMKGIK